MVVTYVNRYGDKFTFTKDEDGNIVWEGNFEFCRIGFPNDYTKAFEKYVKDGGLLSLEEFKKKVHEWDDEKKVYSLGTEYVRMVESLRDQIIMVDPSGGPYISQGFHLEQISKEFKDLTVKNFKRIETGYVIFVNN